MNYPTRPFTSFPMLFRRALSRLSKTPAAAVTAIALGAVAFGAGVLNFAGTALAQTQAQSEPTSVEVFGDWRVECRPNPAGDQDICLMIQTITGGAENRPLAQMAVGLAGLERQRIAVFTVPLGVYLPAGINLSVDGESLGKVTFRHCTVNGCQTELPLVDDVLAKFKGGSEGQILFLDARGKKVPVPISLKGFTAASDSLR